MCGIAGFIDFKNQTSLETLAKMTATLNHRGPDGEGLEIVNNESPKIGFGHKRLSILDLSEHGNQPMKFEQYWICYNGEIYNFQEIKTELIQLGHTFNGDSDTEMILHAYHQWGEKCLDRFIGMFAFVILDSKSQTVFSARDRTGVKPFFYYFKDGLFLFASELKVFHAHPFFKKEIDPNSVAAFMQYGNVPTPHCIFTDCLKLQPGHFMKFDLMKGLSSIADIKQQLYWNVYDAYNLPKLDIDYASAKNQTESLLTSAFNYRMVSDVPVGVFLSGGYDSACVTAILQKSAKTPLKTFTIGVPDIGLNEAPYAKDVAKHLGTDHTELYCTKEEAQEIIPDLPYYFDEPFADSSAIPTTLVSKMAREKVTVALSADGGDEIFAGYNRYDYMMRYGKKLNAIPGVLRKSMAGIMQQVSSEHIPILRDKYNFHNRYEKLKNVLKDPSNEQIMLSLSQQFTNDQMKHLMETNFNSFSTAYQSKALTNNDSPLAYMMAIDYQTYLVDDILQKVDRATMTHSLEGREPFLDHRIVEFAAQLPDDYKYHNGVKKRIIKDIVHDYIPYELMNRPKMGFAIPIADWLSSDLKNLVEDYLSEDIISKQGLFNWGEVNRLKNAFFNGKKEYDVKIWYLLTFQMWYAKWMN